MLILFYVLKLIADARGGELPILVNNERSEYKLEGFVILDKDHIIYTDDNQSHLAYETIEAEEITDTNKENSYYIQHFVGKV